MNVALEYLPEIFAFFYVSAREKPMISLPTIFLQTFSAQFSHCSAQSHKQQ
jgi:hypothetical protein